MTDPKSGRRLVLSPGEEPAPHLAALVQNPAAWEDGNLPDAAETGDDRGDASGGTSDAPGSADPKSDETPDKDSDDTKPAARKTAAKKPARGRTAAAEGTGGQ
ncbi:hypothetical protein pZL12.62c [Streptomyces phage ZL12]|uniref:Uncharacterized protein n=1 Tax=Streptomyces phage ZL12 TaxID=2570911 RepID=D0UWG7_9CAUD|nr:hypothetical protein QEH43_gp062 [Streptomyces phage ZL12]ACX71139.1 hypothetical protein pZL12.62c [Streptomyces phage ZL12]